MSNLKNKNINTDLAGLLVISIEQAVAGPYASGRLADAGARVIKIERPEGDFARKYDAAGGNKSSYFIWLNRGKESICLDLKKNQKAIDAYPSLKDKAESLLDKEKTKILYSLLSDKDNCSAQAIGSWIRTF